MLQLSRFLRDFLKHRSMLWAYNNHRDGKDTSRINQRVVLDWKISLLFRRLCHSDFFWLYWPPLRKVDRGQFYERVFSYKTIISVRMWFLPSFIQGAFIGFHGEGLKRVTQAGRLPQTPVHCVSGDRFWFSAMRTIQQVNCMSASNCYLDPTVMLKSLLWHSYQPLKQ